MGNGANSRPENPVVMQPTRRPVPQTNGYYGSQPAYSSGSYAANGDDGRLQPHYGSHSQYSRDPALRNGWASQPSGTYGSGYSNYGVDRNMERTVAPYSSSNSRSHYRKERHDRNHGDSSIHQSALSSHNHAKRAKSNGQLRNGNQLAYDKTERKPYSTSDEILFEVFHCLKTGRDYSVINVDGERYLVDFWNPGIGQYIFYCFRGGEKERWGVRVELLFRRGLLFKRLEVFQGHPTDRFGKLSVRKTFNPL